VLTPRATVEPVSQQTAGEQSPRTPAKHEGTLPMPSGSGPRVPLDESVRPTRTLDLSAAKRPEPIIPSEDRAAYAKLAATLADRKDLAAELIAEPPNASIRPLMIEPLQIALLCTEPLEAQPLPSTLPRQTE